MNSVHTQMIKPRINMPNTMIMPIEIEVNKRLSPIKYPWSTIFKNDVTLFSINRWFTFEDIDETDTWLQSVWLNRKSFVNIISIVTLKEIKKYIISLIMGRDNFMDVLTYNKSYCEKVISCLESSWYIKCNVSFHKKMNEENVPSQKMFSVTLSMQPVKDAHFMSCQI